MNKTLIKTLIVLSCLAIQGCLVDISPHPPRPRPDTLCHSDWDCPIGSYCEIDGFCYDVTWYSECRHDYDCPIGAYCGPNGLCYDDLYHLGECWSDWDCPPDSFCAANGSCYHYYHWWSTRQEYFGLSWSVFFCTQAQTSHQKKSVCWCVVHHLMNWSTITSVSVRTISYEKG